MILFYRETKRSFMTQTIAERVGGKGWERTGLHNGKKEFEFYLNFILEDIAIVVIVQGFGTNEAQSALGATKAHKSESSTSSLLHSAGLHEDIHSDPKES